MDISIRQYTPADKAAVEKLMTDFQHYLMGIDTVFQKMRCEPDFGEKYTAYVLKKIAEDDGVFYVALNGEEIVGLGLARLDEQSESDIINEGKIKYGKIMDLYIDEKYRQSGLGKRLVEEMEKYLKGKGCEMISVGVIATNPVHDFYHKLGYQDMFVDLLKKI
jgi:ribosomal protein S18 acetylase RimI-like enzyme